MFSKALSPDDLEQLVKDTRLALERRFTDSDNEELGLSFDSQQSPTFLMISKLMRNVEEVKARLEDKEDGLVPPHVVDDIKIRKLEDALWTSYDLEGEVVPDELLKECQRRLKDALPGSKTAIDLEDQLSVLNGIQKYRKARSFHRHPSEKKWTEQWAIYLATRWAKVPGAAPQAEMKSKGPRFWALIIGNDLYENFPPLGGCVNDANLIRDHLTEYLGVPPDHIFFLQDALRDVIINALYDLRDNDKIQRGDNIVIHFSGHGSSYDSSEYFTTFPSKAGSIEAICPIDRGESVPDISDRELNLILSEIGAEKSANITLILDCCHSGGLSRAIAGGLSPLPPGVRYIPPIRDGPQNLELQIMLEAAHNNPRRRPGSPLATTESWQADLSSFVTLAACQDYELASEFNVEPPPVTTRVQGRTHGEDREDTALNSFPRGPMVPDVGAGSPSPGPEEPIRHGRFTWALVMTLQSGQASQATYESIIRSIGQLGPLQQPVAIGLKKSSKLWFRDAE